MTRRAVRFALHCGAAEGSRDAIDRALAGLDPVLRWRATRRVRVLLARSAQATCVGDTAHQLRLAALQADKGVPEAVFDDVEGIAAEFAELEAPAAPRRGPWLVGGAAAFALVLGLAWLGVWIWTRPFDPSKTAAGHLLAGPMEDFVVAADREPMARPALDRARDEAQGRAARRALGGKAAAQLGKLLSSAQALAGATPHNALRARDGFFAATASFDISLADAKLPYFVDADLLPRPGIPGPLLYAFYIQRDKLVQAGARRVRVVDVWRLDRLNVRQNYLGYTRANTPAALVLFDQIETELVRLALPAVPPGEYAAIVDDATRASHPEWAKPIEAHAAEVIRRHYALLPPPERADALRIGKLLARRRALIEKWQPELSAQGLRLHVPDRLIPERHYSRDLNLRVPRAELREWDAVCETLLEPRNLRAFVRLRDHYVASVERHEVQHRLDYARGLVPVPPILVRLLGVSNPLDAPQGSLAARSRDELSAYLAELAASPDSPLLQLMLLSRVVLDNDLARAAPPYFYATLGAYQGIGEELGLNVEALLSGDAPFRKRFVKLVFAVVDQSPAAIRAAAARCYQKQFGHAVEVVRPVRETDYPAWRH